MSLNFIWDKITEWLKGLLVGGIVYLQLTALIVLALRDPRAMPLMVAGAVLLVLLRLSKKVFPEVSAS